MDLFDDNEENCVSDKEYHNYITFAKKNLPQSLFIWGIVTRCFFYPEPKCQLTVWAGHREERRADDPEQRPAEEGGGAAPRVGRVPAAEEHAEQGGVGVRDGAERGAEPEREGAEPGVRAGGDAQGGREPPGDWAPAQRGH